MSSFAPATSAASAASAATTAAASTTTTTTAPAAAANSSSSSPNSSGDAAPAGQQQSSSSDGSSPMRRIPAVMRAPPTSTAQSAPQPAPNATTRSQSQAQMPQQPQQQQQPAAPAPSRDLSAMRARHMYPNQGYAGSYSGASSPLQPMQPQYYSDGDRLTSSGYRNMSPVSSPAMAGDSWAQSQSAAATAASVAGAGPRGLKRHLQPPYDSPSYGRDSYGRTPAGSGPVGNMSMRMAQQQMQNPGAPMGSAGTPSTLGSRRGPASVNGTSVAASNASGGRPRQGQMQQMYGVPPNEDPMQYEPSGESRHPRDSTRYETWTSKQLRKKCSHLKLRGLKNVKKHVMVEALYRYYRNQRLKDMADASTGENNVASQPPNTSQQQRRMEPRRTSIGGSSTGARPDLQYRSRYDQPSQSQYGSHSSRSRGYGNYGSQSPSPPSSGGDSGPSKTANNNGYYLDDESKGESQYKEVPVTSEDVIRLVDVVLSPEFVDRLAAELSRWQFWVDVREMYIALLNRQHPPGSAGAANSEGGPVGTGGSATNSRNFKWSSMQLWEIWKELSFAYTKTCFEFTAAGMNKRVDDREYINFCDGRPDVYYLHQRLHARPDLLHLIKSNEYIDEKCTSEASESIAHEQQQAQQHQQQGPLVGSGSPMLRGHKRYKRSGPMVGNGPASGAYNSARVIAAYRADGAAVNGTVATGGNSADNRGSGDSRGHSPEENSTENSETTGEEGSSNAANSNASNSSVDVSMRAALAEQKYFGLLLQNFEVIFESLHNKKVLLATLRKDSKAPDHMIADLHDDIHVLSALKKEFRNKLRRTMQ